MKQKFLIALSIFFLLTTLSVQAKEKSKGSMALAFAMENGLLQIESYTDGGQVGMGLKYWLSEQLALRGLLSIASITNVNSNASPVELLDTTTIIGIGAGAEYHLIKGPVSPYIGGLAGIKFLFEDDHNPDTPADPPAADYYFGALFGAEALLKDWLSVFAEYSLLASFTANEYTLNLAAGNGAKIGLLFYFK